MTQSEAYVRRMRDIQHMVEEKEYSQMVGTRFFASQPFGKRTTPANEMAKAFTITSVGVNLLVAMVTCFVAGYFVGFQAFNDQPKVRMPDVKLSPYPSFCDDSPD